jgi:hypothetical protein
MFGRRKAKGTPDGGAAPERTSGATRKETLSHLADFVATRVGVEGYIEPPNSQIQTTLLLIATTGEWTRRKVPDAKTAREIAAQLGVPVYDVNFTGYPQRMRDWNAAQRKTR